MEELENFTFEKFCQAHKVFSAKYGTPENKEYDKHLACYTRDLRKGLLAHLEKNPHLKQIKGLNGHKTKYSQEWADLVEGKSPQYGDFFELEESLSNVILFEFLYDFNSEQHSCPVDKLPKYYQQLVTFTREWEPVPVENVEGKFRLFLLRSDCQACYECGRKIKLELFTQKGVFQPMMAEFVKKEDGRWGYQIAPVCSVNVDNEKISVQFKSSTVYVADWFRIKGFLEVVDEGGKKQFEKMDSRQDFVNIAKRYAQDHNFVKISMGNCCPYIYQNGDEILVARQIDVHDYDEETDDFILKPELEGTLASKFGFEEKGMVCTDLWATCLIDHDTLVGILKKAGNSDPEKDIKEWLANSDNTVLQVNPGTYDYCFNGFYSEFEQRREGQKFSDIQLYAMICRKDL